MRDSFLAPVYGRVNAFIAAFGKEHGFRLILGSPPGGVLWADSACDLTEEVARELIGG